MSCPIVRVPLLEVCSGSRRCPNSHQEQSRPAQRTMSSSRWVSRPRTAGWVGATLVCAMVWVTVGMPDCVCCSTHPRPADLCVCAAPPLLAHTVRMLPHQSASVHARAVQTCPQEGVCMHVHPLMIRSPPRSLQGSLAKLLLFNRLEPHLQRKIVQEMHERRVGAGEILMKEGDTGLAATELFVVKEGKFEVRKWTGLQPSFEGVRICCFRASPPPHTHSPTHSA